MEQPPYQQPYQQPPQYQNYGPQQPVGPVMSVGGWIVTFLLMMIPLVNIIMLIVWAAGGNDNPSRKNWAIASLLMWVVYIVIFVLAGSAIIGMISSLAN